MDKNGNDAVELTEKIVSKKYTRNEKILFLDDRSKRLHSALEAFGNCVTLVCTAKECIKMLDRHEWSIVHLDHDLCFEEYVNSDREDCGMEVVRWLEDNPFMAQKCYQNRTCFVIHSSNKTAASEMEVRLTTKGYDAEASRWSY